MLIGSNNSLTYLEPSSIGFKIFESLGKCQEVDHIEQYTYYGVRLFDFKLYIDKYGHIIAKNGAFDYPIFSFYEILNYLNRKDDVIIMLTLESSDDKDKNILAEKKFLEICKIIETIYEKLKCCGGYRNRDKAKLYDFKWEKENSMPIMINPCKESLIYKFVSKFCPMLIGKLNTRYIEKYKEHDGYLILNYVNRA